MYLSLLTDADAAAGGSSTWMSWVLIGLVIVAFIAMIVFSSRRNKKRQQEAEKLINAVKPGNKVKTIGGICGIVVEVDDAENTFVLETGSESTEKCYIRFDKQAIYQTDAVVEEDAKDGKKEGEEKPESSQSEATTDEPVAEQQPAPVEQAEETSSEPAYDDKQ